MDLTLQFTIHDDLNIAVIYWQLSHH